MKDLLLFIRQEKFLSGILFLSVIQVFLVYYIVIPPFSAGIKISLSIIYCIQLIILFNSAKDNRWIIWFIYGMGLVYRVIIIYQISVVDYYGIRLWILPSNEWIGYFGHILGRYFKDNHLSYLILTIITESVIYFLLVKLLNIFRTEREIPLVYWWNPFVIFYLYGNMDPLILWNMIIIICSVLIVYQKRVFASLIFSLALGIYDLSVMYFSLLFNQLKGYVVIPVLVGISVFIVPILFRYDIFPGYLEFVFNQSIYSDWLQNVFSFLGGSIILGWKEYIKIFFLSIFLSAGVWTLFSRRNVFEKSYLGFYILVLSYPEVFIKLPILLILFGTIYMNIGILLLSLYIFFTRSFVGGGFIALRPYDLIIQYTILVGCLPLSIFFHKKNYFIDGQIKSDS